MDKPEPGVLPEALVRAIGVEALEDALEGVRRDARAVVVDGDDDLIAQGLAVRRRHAARSAQRDSHLAARPRERAGVVDADW